MRISELRLLHIYDRIIDMNTFEHKNLINTEVKTQKRKSLFRSLIKPVEAGAHGTLNYVVKKGLGKNKIAKK